MILQRTRSWIAAGLFLVVFAASQDFWTWNHPVAIGFWGLPRWVYGFAALQLIVTLAVVLYGHAEPNDAADANSTDAP